MDLQLKAGEEGAHEVKTIALESTCSLRGLKLCEDWDRIQNFRLQIDPIWDQFFITLAYFGYICLAKDTKL